MIVLIIILIHSDEGGVVLDSDREINVPFEAELEHNSYFVTVVFSVIGLFKRMKRAEFQDVEDRRVSPIVAPGSDSIHNVHKPGDCNRIQNLVEVKQPPES